MSTLQDTLQLDLATWDLMLDGGNNLAIQHESAAVAQDVASVVSTYQGECWFDVSVGVPYLSQVLGKHPSNSLLASLYNTAALTVPGVAEVKTTFNALTSSRKLSGTVEVIDTVGRSMNARFGV